MLENNGYKNSVKLSDKIDTIIVQKYCDFIRSALVLYGTTI